MVILLRGATLGDGSATDVCLSGTNIETVAPVGSVNSDSQRLAQAFSVCRVEFPGQWIGQSAHLDVDQISVVIAKSDEGAYGLHLDSWSDIRVCANGRDSEG